MLTPTTGEGEYIGDLKEGKRHGYLEFYIDGSSV